MRVTNNMRQDQVLRNLQAGMAALMKAQEQVSTGKRFSRPSEDPVAAAAVLRSDRGLRGITQYRRNVTSVRTKLDTEESVLDQVSDLLSRAKELAVSQGSDTANSSTRASAAIEVDRLIEQVVNLGNTKVGNDHLFAGFKSDTAPFQPNGTYVGDDGVRQAEISAGYVIDVNHTGRQLFVDSGTLSSLINLRDQLQSGSAATIQASVTGLDAAFAKTQDSIADVGSRSRQLDIAGSNLDALESSLEAQQNADQGIDLEAATTQLLSIQNTLQAALLSTSRIIGTSLTDYLR